jgi:hypothetical protein
MSDTVHKQTVLNMIERDVENKYDYIKQNSLTILTSLSSSIPLLKVVLPSVDKWLVGKEKQFLPKIQDMVNLSVESSFSDSETSIEDGYNSAKQLINDGIDELIKAHSSLSLESVDQIFQILLDTKLSL